MSYLLAANWGWLLAALIFGAVIGWWTCSRERGTWFTGWVPWALAAFAIGLVAALLAWLPGRAGYLLELALLLFASYIVGCCLGCWFRQLSGAAGDSNKSVAASGAAVAATAAVAAKVSAPVAAPPAAPKVSVPVATAVAPASGYAGGPLTQLPEPVFSALRAGLPRAAPVALAAGAAAVAAPVAAAKAAPVAAVGGAITGLPEPLASSLRQRLPATSGVVAPVAPIARSAAVPVVAAASGTLTGLPEPVASALRQRMAYTYVPVTPHIMSGIGRPAAAPVAVAPKLAPLAAPIAVTPGASPAPTATLRPGSATTNPATAASTGLPEPVASALRQHIPLGDHATAQLGGAAVRVTTAPVVAMAAPAPVTLAHETQSGTVRLEAYVGQVTAVGQGSSSLSLHGHPGSRPAGMPIARGGKADDLLLIKGVGPRNEQILYGLGIYHFDQIAHWTPQETEWVGSYMSFPGRIEREHWIAQCRLLAAGGETDHAAALRSGVLRRGDIGDAGLSAADASSLHASLADVAPALPDEDKHEGQRPFGLAKPRGGTADDLKRVRGIGPQNEGRLHGLGIWHFSQIARWTAANVQWVGSYLAFPGRIDREDWIAQAKVLASGQDTAFSKRVDAGEVATSKDNGSKGQGNVAKLDPKA